MRHQRSPLRPALVGPELAPPARCSTNAQPLAQPPSRLASRTLSCSSGPLPAKASALRRQGGFFCAHVLRRSREPVEVTRAANSACRAPQHLQPLAAGRVGLSSTHPVRLAPRTAAAAAGALGHQARRHCGACQVSVWPANTMPPNMPLNRTRHGRPPWPRNALVHHAPRGQGGLPRRAG